MNNNKNNCWIYKNNEWIPANAFIDKNGNKSVVLENGNMIQDVITYPSNSKENSDIDNLIDLVHLNEPSILYSSLLRYSNDKIYTFTGKILLAINPFKRINIYNDEYIKKYSTSEQQEVLAPHPYQISQQCLDNLNKQGRNQVVLVSGESGAGKTVTTKFLMKYISSVSKKRVVDLEDKILASNPIMEAFGNAKTLRNDNSSRFGKFIKLQFSKGILIGAKIETYLLEKIRLTGLCQNERNFHIFYMLLKCHPEFKCTEMDFNYINKSKVVNRDDGVTDQEMYTELFDSFDKLGFCSNEVDNILNFTYFILLLGNVNSFDDLDSIRLFVEKKGLDLDIDLLSDYLKVNVIRTTHEEIRSERSEDDFLNSRDTIAQNLYLLLFNYIVSRINSNISSKNEDGKNYIGILDIFGFEVFKNNGFEQLCINYTNERLQNIFNKYIFELEQEEYKKENIDWEDIEFESNKKIISLIDNKTNSIFSYQIEQSILGSGSDKAFYQALYNNLMDNNNFDIGKKDLVKGRFTVYHYAGEVLYNSINYIEKNRNTLDKRLNTFIGKSGNEIIKQFDSSIFSIITKKIKNKNIIVQFKGQLDRLLNEIVKQNQFYIRCIKPNDLNIKNNFNKERVLEQFRYCGVLEAIKIARLGYPVRIKNDIFVSLYYSLLHYHKISVKDEEMICDLFVRAEYDPKEYKIGLTKVFLKKELHNRLNDDNNKVRDKSAKLIQKTRRMMLVLKRVEIFRRFILFSQYLLKRWFVKKSSSVTTIGSFWRRIVALMEFKRVKNQVLVLQSLYRMFVEKRQYKKILCAFKVQRFYRWYKFKLRFDKLVKVEKTMRIKMLRKGFNQLKDKAVKNHFAGVISRYYRRYRKKKELKNRVSILQELEEAKQKIYELEMVINEYQETELSLTGNIGKIEKELENMRDDVVGLEDEKDVMKGRITELEKKLVSKTSELMVCKNKIVDLNERKSVEVETSTQGEQCEILHQRIIDNACLERDMEKQRCGLMEKQLIVVNRRNGILKTDVSNKNKIILNLSGKFSELNNVNLLLKKKIRTFETDQEILGGKMKNLYLKIDYYEDLLKRHGLANYL